MALLYLIIALIIQGSFTTYANVNDTEEITTSKEILDSTTEVANQDQQEEDDDVVKDFHEGQKDWIDLLLLPDAQLYPTSSAILMAQAANSDKSVEDQLEDIKEIAQKITLAIQSEMTKLLCYALAVSEKETETEDNNMRKKRSAESPMDSTQLVMRLLKHIKSNNEYQNIAIEKMMTAQEIADKYGIEYRPDTEILSDLAYAANHQAKEMTSLLQDACDMKNITKNKEIVPEPLTKEHSENDADYVYGVPYPEESVKSSKTPVNHFHHAESYPNYNYYYNYPYETQISSPPVQNYYSPPVSKRPNFYDTVSYAPHDYYPYCSVESVSPLCEEPVEPAPELVGEEFEETVTSKVMVDRGDEPGSATVNHVMTYTISEKSHFRNPEIERLPQQMQYCFFMM